MSETKLKVVSSIETTCDAPGWEGIDPKECELRQFDLDQRYGPCTGITRLQRWQRAKSFGLAPPDRIQQLLSHENVKQTSLWS